MQTRTELKLEVEVAQGDNHKRAWEQIVEPFFEAKKAELFEAFVNTGSSETDALVSIKMHMNVLESMKDHFWHYINTGKMAQKTLEEMNNGN